MTFQAWNGPGFNPRLSNHWAIPGPDRTDCRWRHPWAKIMMPSHTRANARAKSITFSLLCTAPPRLSRAFADEATRVGVG